MDNKHFLQFMNKLGITTMDIAKTLEVSYGIANRKVTRLDFDTFEICKLSEWTTISVLDLMKIILGDSTIKEIIVPYAITKEMAIARLRQDPDFLRMIIECYNVGAGQKDKTVTQSDIYMMKKHLNK